MNGTLRSPRLMLDPVVGTDLTDLHAHWTEPGVRRYLWDGRTVSEDEVRAAIETSKRLFDEHRAGLWAIREVDSPTIIGCGGVWYFHEPPELELVLSLSSVYWGRGLAQEAACTLMDHVLDELDWPFVQASADAPNLASLALMRRLGMRPTGERPGEFGGIEVYRITRADWRRPRMEPRPEDL